MWKLRARDDAAFSHRHDDHSVQVEQSEAMILDLMDEARMDEREKMRQRLKDRLPFGLNQFAYEMEAAYRDNSMDEITGIFIKATKVLLDLMATASDPKPTESGLRRAMRGTHVDR